MTQLSPSTLYQSQAVALLLQMREFFANAKDNTNPDEVAKKFHDLQTKFTTIMGRPLTEYEPVVKGEPPNSDKMNRFISQLQYDINILEDQIDIMKASSVYVHNYMSTEIEKAKNENAQAGNKLKALQLYTSSSKSDVTIFGDFFKNDELFDLNKVPVEKRMTLLAPGQLALGRETVASANALKDAKLTILSSSNGFPGRLHEIDVTQTGTSDPTTQQTIYTFKAEADPKSTISSMIDSVPTTWFEYENNLVTDADRTIAKDLNFKYKVATSKKEKVHKVDYGVEDGTLLDWSKGPYLGILKLDIEFDLKAIKTINQISYTPFGLEENKNFPVRVRKVTLSKDGTNWDTISPENVWIGTDSNLQTSRANGDVAIGTAFWSFSEREVRYIRINIEQDKSIPSKLGHLYYETPKKVTKEIVRNDDGTTKIVEKISGGERVEGPIPTTADPTKYYGPAAITRSNMVQKTEAFDAQRWVIGVRDIEVNQIKYATSSTMVTKPFKISGIIDRVSLEAQTFIPPEFPTDDLWIKFFVSPDDGINWYPISRVQDDYLGLPEIVVFNDPLPEEFRDKGAAYHKVDGTVNTIRLKVELSRPSDSTSSSPILYWYKLKVRRR